jgi:hypothetical protein
LLRARNHDEAIERENAEFMAANIPADGSLPCRTF